MVSKRSKQLRQQAIERANQYKEEQAKKSPSKDTAIATQSMTF
jgi:hypothetical protein